LKELRESVHDAMNALAIARGMVQSVQNTLEGHKELTPEQQKEKLSKCQNALIRLEKSLNKIRESYRE